VSLAHSDEVPLGREAVERISGAYRPGLDEVERWAGTARSADFDGVPASVRPIQGDGMATDDLMTRALETVGDDGPLSVEVIHVRRRIRELTLAATEYKIDTYGGSTGPDAAALDTVTEP
jgi:hypothetical protein